jgi:CMP-N-acetylneuraminic acid synthetase
MRVLGVIPARGGSKGVPHKNVRLLHGKPLLQYTIQAAQSSKRLSRVILTTEDNEIAQLGHVLGIEVPFLRPMELAQDDTPTLPVLQHAVRWLEANEADQYDVICLLQPTNPLRSANVIDACIFQLEQSGADSLVTMLPVPAEYNPHWVYFRQPDCTFRLCTGERNPIPRRQELPPAYHREGSVYLTTRDVLMEQSTLFGAKLVGYVLSPEQCVNIDSEADWERAETMLRCKCVETI